MSKKFEKGKMVEFPSTAIIPERDLDKTPVLECRHLGIDFGGLRAVDDFNLTIGRTEIAGLIGPNGAGKTTVFNLLTKVYQPTRGTILLDGMDTSGKTTEQINRMGIARTFQNIRLFSDMTVLENLKIGAYLRKDDLSEDLEWVYSLFPRLKEREWQLAGTLSGGEQQMLAVGRALMAKPKLVMMDEPSLGLAPLVVKGIFDIIKEINQEGMAIMLIEQNAQKVLEFCDQAYIMQVGKVAISGKGRDLLEDNAVAAAYLGD